MINKHSQVHTPRCGTELLELPLIRCVPDPETKIGMERTPQYLVVDLYLYSQVQLQNLAVLLIKDVFAD